jgi:hypothetical protein
MTERPSLAQPAGFRVREDGLRLVRLPSWLPHARDGRGDRVIYPLDPLVFFAVLGHENCGDG